MADCTKCGASLPANTLVCRYCGARNDIDLKGIHAYTRVPAPEPRTCPECDIELQSLDLHIEGHFYIERCEKCLGLFFDPDELEKVLDSTVSSVFHIDYKQISALSETPAIDTGNVHYLKCPVCREFMNRRSYGLRSGVIVDTCHDHGTWLQGGELRRLLEWRRSGGQLLHEARKQKQAEEKKRAGGKKKAAVSLRPTYRSSSYFTSSVGHQGDIGDMIAEFIFRLFT